MKVILIVAVAKSNKGIGKNNDLLWHLPADMKIFKSETTGYPIITGRKNYESIPERFRPLPNRENIIISRQKLVYDGAEICHNITDGIEIARKTGKDKCFIIGGGQIYKLALEANLIDELLITWVDANVEADVFFEGFEASNWKITNEIFFPADDKNKYNFTLTHYIKA